MRTNRGTSGREWVKSIEDRLSKLERPTLATIPAYAGDPAQLKEGMIWIDITAMKLKVVHGGVIRSATLT